MAVQPLSDSQIVANFASTSSEELLKTSTDCFAMGARFRERVATIRAGLASGKFAAMGYVLSAQGMTLRMFKHDDKPTEYQMGGVDQEGAIAFTRDETRNPSMKVWWNKRCHPTMKADYRLADDVAAELALVVEDSAMMMERIGRLADEALKLREG